MWLEVTYQGLAAPTGLFADLQLIGWAPPTIAPPPHEAIDWSQPNEATGERFTLRDYLVPNAVVQPPTGAGSRGAWTDPERASHLAALGRVLDRHVDVEVEDPAALVRVPASTVGPPPPPVTGSHAPPPPPPLPATTGFTPSADATAILVTAPLKPSLAPRVEDELVALGVTVVFDSQERVKTERYRGSSYETTVTELHVAAIAAPEQLPAVTAVLTALGLPLTYAEVDDVVAAPEPELGTAAAAGGAATATEVERDIGLACVVALVEPRFGDAVQGVFRALGLVDAAVNRSTRLEISRYRGSRSEREVPTLRVEAWVPEPHALLVANHLAEAAHLQPDDTSRLWIEPADPTPGPVPAAPPTTAAEPAPLVAHAPPPPMVQGPPPPPPPVIAATGAAGPVTSMATSLDPRDLVRRPVPAFTDHGR